MTLPLTSQAEPDSAPSEAFVRRGGKWALTSYELGLVRPPTRRVAAERGRLAYLVQSADARPLAEELCGSVVNALVQTYYAETGSIARGLREALLAANQVLFEHNVRADTASRLLAGIACVVVHGDELHLARLGPACVWVYGEGVQQQFPTESLWYGLAANAATDVDREPPAGLRLDVEPELGHIVLVRDGLAVLLSQGLEQHAQPARLLRALGGDDPEQTRQRLHEMMQGQDLALLAVSLVVGDVPEASASGYLAAGSSGVSAATSFSPAANDSAPTQGMGALAATQLATDGAARPMPEEPAEEWSVQQDATPYPHEPADDHRAGEDLTGVAPMGAQAPDPEWEGDNDDPWAEEAGEEFDEPMEEPATPVRHEHIDLSARAGPVAREAGRAVQSGARRLRNGAEDALLKVLPDRLPERPVPEAPRMPAISPASQSLVVIALLLPLLVLFTVIMVRVQHGRELDGRRGSIRQTAMSEYDQAIKASNPQLQADGLARTLELVEAGLAILPEDEVLVDLRRRATLKEDELNRVVRLYHFKRLDSHTVGGATPNEASRIVIHDKDAMVLNKGAGQVHGYTLSDVGDAVSSRAETQVLLRTSEKRGAIEVAELVDMAWLAPTGSRTTGELVVLDRGGTLWTLRNGVFEAVPVADSDTWLKPVAIGAFMGNLYVLDPLAGRILKYLPNNNAYTTPPFPYLSTTVTVDLLGAVDMAIDGNVYVLFADGTIHKFFDGEEKPFPMTGLPSGIRNPTSIFVSGAQEPQAEGWVYVTDWGNERIVQFDKEGNYIRAFKANTSEPYMTALGGVFVDETTQRMFMFSERQFTLVALPPLPSR